MCVSSITINAGGCSTALHTVVRGRNATVDLANFVGELVIHSNVVNVDVEQLLR